MITLIYFIIVLGVLIFVHELGHFITAKLAGIAVPRFSIGLGPKLWGFRIGETEYVISALPLGGYVKMAGMGEEEAMEALEGGKDDLDVARERRFENKSVGIRAVVISAGVIMNYLFAVFVFAGQAYWSPTSYEPRIGEVEPGSPADRAGVQPGDLVLSVDGNETKVWGSFSRYVGERAGEEVTLEVQRDGRRLEIEAFIALDTMVIPQTGDTIVRGRIGVVRDTLNARRALGPLAALASGTRTTNEFTVIILDWLGEFVTGRASARDLGGPILIGQMAGEAGRAGVAVLIRFMAVLSINLAILNLLPIPILDGGHLLFLAIEAIRGRALSINVRVRWSQVGLILILAIMVWAITNDLLRVAGS